MAEYPESAQRRAIEGWVEIEFLVDAEGKVKNVSVLKSGPTRVFDAAAVKAIRRWEFEPATRDGQPVDSQERRRVVFKL
ncbi:MAG: energy transducer TonB [Gammaproteobacteria bacterium]